MRAALVSGGNRGIGFEVVKTLLAAEPQFRVYLGCRNMPDGEAHAQALSLVYGDRVEAVQLDVTSDVSIEACCRRIGALDILVNNAGVLLEGDGRPFDYLAAMQTMQINFHGVIALTEAFLPKLSAADGGGQILSTSSAIGTRTAGLLTAAHRDLLTQPSLELNSLRHVLAEIIEELGDAGHAYHSIPTVVYGLSKLGVNCYTQMLARQHPTMRINACSPGFTNTRMCASYTGARVPKSVELGASVFGKVLFGELGAGRTGMFFKENSAAGTPVEEAVSVIDPWVQ
jgi:NAD(P)-dependent dehydrogenase (short-subunit alcohol dehydrogenase family)